MTKIKFDIVIVGAGTAGMACAIFASQRGLKVGVVEKSEQIGGAMHWSGGHMSAGGTRLQKEKGIEDSPEKHFEDIMRINDKSGDIDLIRKAVELAPKTIDWLHDLGFEFAPECPRIVYGHVPYETPRTHYGINNAKTTMNTMRPLWNDGVTNGDIQLFLNTTWIGLEKNRDRYEKVLCKNIIEGREFDLQGSHIVITTGGYGSNPNMFAEHHPEIPLVSAAYPNSTGEGIKLLQNKGANFDWARHHLSSMGGIETPPGSGRCDFYKGWAHVLTSVYRPPRDIYVDQSGHRFMKEDEENPDTRERIMLDKKIFHFWVIFDEAGLLERNDDGSENALIIGWNTEGIKAEAKKESFLFAAPTIHELAQKIEVPPTNLIATVDRFNGYVKNGKDADYDRKYLKNTVDEGPFYALKVHASVLVTFGGIRANKNLTLLNRNGQEMNGLYGAGEMLGLGSTSGGAFCSGMAITPALSFGKWLGENLMK